MNIFSARRQPTISTSADMDEVTDPVIMRFLTVGGATVELRGHRFTTRWHPLKGKPNVISQAYETDGYVWECLGCDADGRKRNSYGEREYLPSELDDARDHANEHASACHAMPKPAGSCR